MNLNSLLNKEWAKFTDKVATKPLFTELAGIADALRTLHDHLYIPRNTQSNSDVTGRVLLCHIDLKPENILILKHHDHPLGLWKIADFGISKVKELTEHCTADELLGSSKDGHLTVPGRAIMENNRKFTVHTQAGQHSSTYTVPEFNSSPQDVGRSSDVWSLGCIVVFVCALAQGTQICNDLCSKRGKLLGRDVYDDENSDRFYHKLASGEMVLDPQVSAWTHSLLEQTHYNA